MTDGEFYAFLRVLRRALLMIIRYIEKKYRISPESD
jgi:hypothetical protein